MSDFFKNHSNTSLIGKDGIVNDIFLDRLINDNKIGIGIYTADDFMLIKANQTYINYLPNPYNTNESVIGKKLKDFAPNFEGSPAEGKWKNIVATNQSYYLTEAQGLMLGRDERYWDNNIIPITENGEVNYLVSMLEDVTERVLSREHLRIKEEQLEAIFENTSDTIQIVDKYGNYIARNHLTDQVITQINADNLRSWRKYIKIFNFDGIEIQPEDYTINKILLGEKINHKQVIIEFDKKRKYYDISGKPIFDKNEEILYGVLITQDITAEVEKRKIIEEKNKELEIIIEKMYDGLAVMNKEGKFIKINKALKELMISKTESSTIIDEIGDSFRLGQKYYYEDGRELSFEDAPPSRVLRGEEVKNQRVIVKHGSNKTYIDFNGTPVFDEEGVLKFGIILTHDVTNQIQKENKIKLQQELLLKIEKERREALENALIMKDEFLSLISHEFKTPLNVIYSAIQLIEYAYINKVPERVKELLGNIKQNTFRQLRLVNNLLDITKLNSGRFKFNIKNIDIVLVTELITKSIMLYANPKNIKLSFSSKMQNKLIGFDDEKYERIMLNLLSNAIKFTPSGGSVFVQLDEVKNSNMIQIKVIDTGIGIPKDKQELIFERFGQVESNLSRQAEGTGIGLSLVKLLLDALGGTIELQSELGAGSTFIVNLPANDTIENEDLEPCLDIDNRLINAINVEFSDIYY